MTAGQRESQWVRVPGPGAAGLGRSGSLGSCDLHFSPGREVRGFYVPENCLCPCLSHSVACVFMPVVRFGLSGLVFHFFLFYQELFTYLGDQPFDCDKVVNIFFLFISPLCVWTLFMFYFFQ